MRLRRFSRWPVKFSSRSYKFPWLLSLNYFAVPDVSRFVSKISSIIHVLLKRPEEGDAYVHKCGGASDNRC